ncbi:MAG: putative maltokinase [Gemmatimonadaceae bacterium]|nr:putative maltokinase [Gemmatimonadaceae bacterium]NUQ94292.1 putative maltokinase [Gemmatimonadaceae bacterium]NUS97521.1 putative maltokinase [Gemmatimonadaceae bacterium]
MSERSLPTIRVDGALSEALCADALAELTGAQLGAFLLERRWFGGKGRAPVDVRIGDVIELRAGDARHAVARLDVDMGGRTAFYQLPLAVRREGDDAAGAVLARVEAANGERGVLFDAVDDESFRRALGGAFARGATFGGRARWIVEPVEGDASRPTVGDAPSRTVRAEQSNTSIIFGDAAIMKLFRRMEPGINPDVEIGRFLTTRTHFRHTPPLLGVIRYEGSGDVHAVAGMLQGFLSGSTDAWQDALERSRAWFAREARDDAPHPYASDAEQLGRVTRDLHDALGSAREDADFVPRPARRGDVERWARSARQRVEEATSLLAERLEAGALRDAEPARALLDRHAADLAHLDEIVDSIGEDAGQLIRHHGDYHLGQVLRTAAGDFQIIDFEGEPARPLSERRERSSALRDVAGMLRSFAYAAATLAAERRGKSDGQRLELRASRWERGAREAFLNGYLAGGHADYLPRDRQRLDALLELFEMEKVYYEMSYELNNRPEWVWIPLDGALALRSTPAGRA